MRALASHRGGKTPEHFALPASSLGLAGNPPAAQNKPLVQRKRGRVEYQHPKIKFGRITSLGKAIVYAPLRHHSLVV
jgi:hypothetical protein